MILIYSSLGPVLLPLGTPSPIAPPIGVAISLLNSATFFASTVYRFLTNFSAAFFELFSFESLHPTKVNVIKNRILNNFIIFLMIIHPPSFY